MNDFYYDELLDASFKELNRFASWMNRYLGHYPAIVGGWAVWCYTKGLGSRDIDVVFLNDRAKNETLRQFFFYNDYEEVGTFLEKSYVKKVQTSKRREEIIVDACTASDKRVISGLNITLPWSWALEHSKVYGLSKEAFIYIPIPELLLTYKIGAIHGRMHALKTIRETGYAKAKLWKDFYDAASLLKKCKLDKEKLNLFLTKSGVNKYSEQFIDELESRKDLVKEFELKPGQIKKFLL